MKFVSKSFWPWLFLLLLGCSTTPTEVLVVSPTKTITSVPTKVVFLPTITPIPAPTVIASGIPLPLDGKLYHGVYPGGKTGEEDDLTFDDLLAYENLVGKNATWVYFSNNWYHSRKFPTETATWIRNTGSIPYIRLMLRSKLKFNGNEPVYTLQNIIDGQFDVDLRAWCMKARNFLTPILVEYGTEVNSDSFPWSGIANGAGATSGYGDPTLPDGPERFQSAYRHIIKTCRNAGAVNITWVFHLDSNSYPDAAWNKFENYYPGDEWIDWLGVSIYGVHSPLSRYYSIFSVAMESIHPRILKLAPDKPIIIAEFGTAKNNPLVDQIQWARDALGSLTSLQYENVIGFSWWNEAWENDSQPENDTSMRVQDTLELEVLFRDMIGNNPDVIGEISP